MIYFFFSFLKQYYSGFNVLQYITFRTGGAIMTSFFISFVFGKRFINYLKEKNIGQKVRTDGPKTHLSKDGTPTMGGVLILLSMLVSSLLWARWDNRFIQILVFSTIYLGLVGFKDDYEKLIKKNSKGISARTKLLFQFILAGLIAIAVYYLPPNQKYQTVLNIPYMKEAYIFLGPFYYFLVLLIVIGSSNAVNLTDGLDGLAVGSMIFTALTYMVFSYVAGHAVIASYLKIISVPQAGEITVYLASLVGASIGFLWFNSYPAEVFMGDTGSLFLGGVVGIIAVLIKQELILIISSAIFLIELLSVALQVLGYKYNKKRIFRMAPLHHHFELSGLSEPKIVIRFWIIAIILMLVSLASLKIR